MKRNRNKKWFIHLGIIILIFVIAIVVYFLILKKCPASCDDNNSCTKDICSKETGYKCINQETKPCCGNNNCEKPSESWSKCSEDCNKPSASELALLLSDFPNGWEISSGGPLTSISVGREEGYSIVFRKVDSKDIQILQIIYKFPGETARLVIEQRRADINSVGKSVNGTTKRWLGGDYDSKYTASILNDFEVGEDSIAYKKTYAGSSTGIYTIEFANGEYYEQLEGYDYKLLKELATSAEKMI